MKKILTASVVLISLSIGAIAHADVENQAVADRMAAMKAISGSLKTLGGMAKGAVEFDAAIAQAAVDTVEMQSGALPVLFEAQETDPLSDAKPEIWTNWDDFVSKANGLNATAAAITITDAASVGAALGAIGGTCKGCHSEYRM